MNDQQNISPEQLQEIERFLLQEMSAEEEAAFGERLKNEPALLKITEEMRLLSIGIQESVLERKLGRFHDELSLENEQNKSSRKTVRMNTWLAAAAVIFVLAVGAYFFLWNQNKGASLYAEFFEPDPGLITPMSSTEEYEFFHAMTEYKSGNYLAAIKTWGSLLKVNPSNDTLHYFLGSAYLADDKTDKAIEHFKQVISLRSFFIADAYWYLGLAQLKKGNKEEGLSNIEKSDHPEKKMLLDKFNE